MATALEVATFMLRRFSAEGRLEQKTVAQEILAKFGSTFVDKNTNGHWGIKPSVLRHFGVMTKDGAVWATPGRYWRRRLPNDPPGVRQVSE
jgi:hypothetical protein